LFAVCQADFCQAAFVLQRVPTHPGREYWLGVCLSLGFVPTSVPTDFLQQPTTIEYTTTPATFALRMRRFTIFDR
jgi:hypothetical protein